MSRQQLAHLTNEDDIQQPSAIIRWQPLRKLHHITKVNTRNEDILTGLAYFLIIEFQNTHNATHITFNGSHTAKLSQTRIAFPELLVVTEGSIITTAFGFNIAPHGSDHNHFWVPSTTDDPRITGM
jgi:hypothetical protein